MKSFDRYDWLKWKDIERCPYPPFSNHPKHTNWNKQDDKRMLLIALDRYVDYLQGVRNEPNRTEQTNQI